MKHTLARLAEIVSAPIITDFRRCPSCRCFVELCGCTVEPTPLGQRTAACTNRADRTVADAEGTASGLRPDRDF